MKIVVLAGGVGGSRFLLGAREYLRSTGADPSEDLTAIVNTADDMWLAGLRITPDLDSIMYALADVADTQRGWGRAGESERVSAELAAWGVGWPWFTLGDLDLGAHIARTAWLREGVPLSEACRRLGARWELGVRMLPATDDEAETRVRLPDGSTLHFQEWWTRHRALLPITGFEQPGVETARPAPGVVEAIAAADVVIVGPSNPVVSIGTILAIPGVRDALRSARGPIIGVSPIITGAVVRGMADTCLTTIGVRTAADAVAAHYGARGTGGLLDGWLVDQADAALVAAIERTGIRAAAVPLWMTDPRATASMVAAAIELGRRAVTD